VARNLSNISKVLSEMPSPFKVSDIISSDIDGSIVGIISEGPTVNKSVLYIAATLSFSTDYNLYRLVNFAIAIKIMRTGTFFLTCLQKSLVISIILLKTNILFKDHFFYLEFGSCLITVVIYMQNLCFIEIASWVICASWEILSSVSLLLLHTVHSN